MDKGYVQHGKSRRVRVLRAINCALEGKKFQIMKLENEPFEKRNLIQPHIDYVLDEQAALRELRDEIKSGARI